MKKRINTKIFRRINIASWIWIGLFVYSESDSVFWGLISAYVAMTFLYAIENAADRIIEHGDSQNKDILLEKIIKETHVSHGENLLTVNGKVEITDAEQAYISSITERST